jgi:outer membrane immunogenic protein
VGYAIGGGYEYGFTQNWSSNLEYLYMDFGESTVTHFDTTHNDTFEFSHNIHTAKISVNYHLGSP